MMSPDDSRRASVVVYTAQEICVINRLHNKAGTENLVPNRRIPRSRFHLHSRRIDEVLGLNSEAASIISEYSSTLPKRRHIKGF